MLNSYYGYLCSFRWELYRDQHPIQQALSGMPPKYGSTTKPELVLVFDQLTESLFKNMTFMKLFLAK
jgi:hypothetical protein